MSHLSERGITPDLPIRNSGKGFRGEEARYKAKLSAVSPFPPGLVSLAHCITWPADMANPLAHLTAYPDDPNYSVPSPDEIHGGLDIQLPLGTPIVAPEDAIVTIVDQNGYGNKVHGFADIMLYSETSGIVYWLVHLDANSIPEHIKQRHYFDKWSSPLKVNAGDQLGTVGEFFNDGMRAEGKSELSEEVIVPEDVLGQYARTYNHLHLETHYEPAIEKLSFSTRNPVNPIRLFKRLY